MEKPAALKHIPFLEIIDNANDIIMVTKAEPLDLPGPEIVYVNNAFTNLTGYTAEEAVGNTPRMLQGPETDPITRNEIREALHQKKAVRTEVLNYTKSGKAYWLDLSIVPLKDESGAVKYFAAIERDLTRHKTIEEQLNQLASTDALTNTVNRRVFFEKANYELKRIQRSKLHFGLLMIDIDNFKKLNDQYGHQAGDTALQHIATTIKNQTRDIDVVGRYGGEEFIVLLPLTDQQQTTKTAEKLRQAVANQAFSYNNQTINITVSIGCTVCLPNEIDINPGISRADQALYRAKDKGKNCCQHKFP